MGKIIDKITRVFTAFFWIMVTIYLIVITVISFRNHRLERIKKLYEIEIEQKKLELLELKFKNNQP